MLNEIDVWLTNFLMSIGIWGYFLSCGLIIIESIVPILPLSVFITLLFYKFGYFIGGLISYVFTVIGCLISYKIFNSNLRIKFEKFMDKREKGKLKKLAFKLRTIRFRNLCIIIALPFTPAFLINIAAGLSNMSKKKYFYALLIGKFVLIIFWGLIGTGIINSIKKPINLIFIGLIIVVIFIVSRLVNRKEGLE